ncbi:Gfo/Idh/MocA family protein [Actinomadura kijaniata]|uniref:Gfo/Idh/MocA family protein n=1 Tax=Actinomadura kijaniata TaxID=46161 RepID=UPI0008318798|nr:Gfo/Idh/MocA family oxidoreductase [Actinomadura kijaniata]
MTVSPVRVGIIGANADPGRGWAAVAHVPALAAAPGLALTAVGTSREDSAREAARAFGVPHAFADAGALAAHPEVDLVTVAVKVPHHAELVRAALKAGKHVLSEWPLALTTEEARSLAAEAEAAGVRHAIGLQARHSPGVRYARELVAEGRIGRVLAVTAYSARPHGADGRYPAASAYTADSANGAGLLEVAGGHVLDALQFVAGDIAELSAHLSRQVSHYTVAETGETFERTAPDQVLVHATLAGGAVASVHLSDRKAANPRTRLEIAGTDGDLVLVTDLPDPRDAQLQIGAARVLEARTGERGWRELPVPDRFRTVRGVPEATVRNVAEQYAALAADIRTGGAPVADFGHAVRLHGLLDAVRRSAETGTRQRL